MRHRVARFLVALVAVQVFGLSACGGGSGGPGVERADDAGSADYSYVIPEGTGDRLDRGEVLDILPARLDAQVGEVIRIENDDDRSHSVGPFFVGAHQVLTQRFSTTGNYVGACYVHSSGQFELVVTDA